MERTSTPLVTVIIPNYNHSKFLEKRIETVLHQTFEDYELILMDDKSTDDSLSILKKYEQHPRVSRLIVNEENSKSTFKQWNKGIAMAKGEYIWIAESDDTADADFLKTLVGKISQDKNIGIVYSQSLGIDETGKVHGDCRMWTADLDPEKWNHDFKESGSNACAEYLIIKNIIPNASAVLFRKSVYLGAGAAPEDMKLCGDWLMWARMLTISDLYYVSGNLNGFRFHSNSTRGVETLEKVKNKTREDLRVVAYILKHHPVGKQKSDAALTMVMTNWMSFFDQNRNLFTKVYQLRSIFSEFNLSFPRNYTLFILSYIKGKLSEKL